MTTSLHSATLNVERKYILSIDQGTTSSRAILFNKAGENVAQGQLEHEQIFPKAGWVEHNATEIWQNVRKVVAMAMANGEVNHHEIAAVGITNQRETTVVWDKNTGEPVYNAIVWQDTRTQEIVEELAGEEGVGKYHDIVGLNLSTYFSGPKIKWILDNVEGARERAERGDLLFGNTDTWLGLEPDRRCGRRRARHRRDQRIPYPADEHPHPAVGSADCRRHGHPHEHAARD